MEAVELARKLQEEATCSICLDYFTDPVMTACGHNFCRACIQLSWEKARGKKGRRKRKGSFPCPECRAMSPQRNLLPNRLLTKVAEMARQHPGLQKQDLCQEHQEPLKLFCQEDQSPICVVCRESREHRLHRVLPAEEAVQGYKLKLEEDMEYLREQITRTGNLQAREEQSLAEWQGKVKERRERIVLEFEKMNLYLLEEEQRLLQALEREEEETASRLQESVDCLDRQGHSLELLLLQLEERSTHGPLQMLQDMKEPLSRKNNVSVQCPEVAPPTRPRTVCRVPGQIEVLRGFLEDVVPDATSAYPYLLLYESRQRRYLSSSLEGSRFCSKDRFMAYPCAVGQTTFSSGRHYWEVGMNITGDALWALGVCRDNVSRKDRVPKCPENGFWVVQLSKGTKYLSTLSAPIPVMLMEPPSHVGVFLDFEAGEVSFYSVSDGSHLHTYSQATFPGPLQPFFCLGAPKSGQMVISTVTMWVKG
ncbi:E3 ubiquitin-protein ligase TRIM17 isoform X1 [Macaca thibetana thibetana]|uniref:E3 ubiquitin-protein ligase TRIM17 isoform X1 n=1 Tax=Macaca thibetana thibetana TaxID=257877 RepID=UPI0021BCB2CA|nr:E3 ubiquitin-protein ligase TRIM17 isoform X1 [Macaca thibetana thibetana]XP_050613884.1 E3 ubiquitin-protein ligase TRIM17 isoform X1 [Macaca thibetana thibetana]XP_050613894.1 E3 ubiquitin-protein ligase TRIM17 isoform X1 [Macaca thibetana thibetana]